jgi:hypothetical protein
VVSAATLPGQTRLRLLADVVLQLEQRFARQVLKDGHPVGRPDSGHDLTYQVVPLLGAGQLGVRVLPGALL